MTAEDAAGVPARIAGGQAGGLVGVSGQELTIRGSFAATTVSGSANAGGLVGYAALMSPSAAPTPTATSPRPSPADWWAARLRGLIPP